MYVQADLLGLAKCIKRFLPLLLFKFHIPYDPGGVSLREKKRMLQISHCLWHRRSKPEGEQNNFTLPITQEESAWGRRTLATYRINPEDNRWTKLDYNTCASSLVLASHLGHSSQSFNRWRACLCALFSLRSRWNLLRGSVFASCFSSMPSAHARSAHTSGR